MASIFAKIIPTVHIEKERKSNQKNNYEPKFYKSSVSNECRSFLDYLGGLESIRNKNWQVYRRPTIADIWGCEFRDLDLADLEIIGTIGAGGYGRVELVTVGTMPNVSFARKKVRKYMITQRGYQKLIYNEKQNLRLCTSPFICK